MMRWWVVAAVILFLTPNAAWAAPAVEVEIADDRVEAVLGDTRFLEVTVFNRSDHNSGPLLGHLVVVDPGAEGSADAEDWTDMITRPIAAVDPGESTTVEWDVTPISTGRFFVMVTVVPEDPALAPGVSSNTVFEVLQSAESLQASVLPVALAVPVALGAVAWFLSRRERRRLEGFAATA